MKQLGLVLKEEGTARVYEHSEDWGPQYVAHIKDYAETHREFTAEQVRANWLSRGGGHPHHHNAYGAAIRVALTRGYIKPTGRYTPALSPATHGHPVAIWRSALWKTGTRQHNDSGASAAHEHRG